MGRKQRKIDATPVPGRAKRIGHAIIETDHRVNSAASSKCPVSGKSGRITFFG
jgi:hypothetical protein